METKDGGTRKFGEIVGLLVRPLQINIDDRGLLTEVVRTDWQEVKDSLNYYHNAIEQIYLVKNETLAIRAFHKHKFLVDFFCIVNGSAKFIFIDDRKESSTYGNTKIVNVSDKKISTICVPTGVFHGWKAEAGTILVSVANALYMGVDKKDYLDEVRIAYDTFGKELWDTQNK